MKKLLSLLLAVLMVVTLVPAFTLSAFAADDTSLYVIYDQDFNALDNNASEAALLEALGWQVPASKVDTNGATYSIVQSGANKVLRVNTLGATDDSFINILDNNAMAILRNTNFELSYRLTYREETTNPDGYTAIIYNYNGMHGSVADGTGNEVYGIVAVRMCGTGLNAVYYPAAGANCDFHALEKQVGSSNVLANRYDTPSAQPSLYSRLTGAYESDDTIRSGTAVMANKVLNIKLAYNYAQGVAVYINEQLVSESIPGGNYNKQIRNDSLWNDFLTRNDGYIVGLLTKPGVVADIDNIKITSTSIEAAGISANLPALLITEIIGAPDPAWAEFIEIYNPNDYAVDIANYSIARSGAFTNGTAIDAISGSRQQKYNAYINLDTLIGSNVKSSAFYVAKSEIEKMPAGTYEYVDSTSYTKDESGSYVASDEGGYRRIYYVDNWNTRYTRGSADYNTNTMLNPGETLVIHFKELGYAPAWQNLTNDGSLSQTIASKGFRYNYRNYGLTENTKVLVTSTFNIPDAANATYYIGAAYDENSNEINYKSLYADDLTYIESYVEWTPGIATGNNTLTTSTSDSKFGQAGIQQSGYSGAYVYGVDASGDYRKGTLYTVLNPTKKAGAHVGKQAGYQEIIIGNFYRPTETSPALMITEIIPRTNNLAGQDLNAFSAIELTNTSSYPVDAYNFALVRTPLDTACRTGMGFTYATDMRAGNPVQRVTGNGSYYFFAEDHITNPDECILAPGETMVVWFLTEETYDSYHSDLDFGVNYFRQYWANNGSPELAVKGSDGEYAVKVVAVDGCTSTSYNGENSAKVFHPSSTGSAVYGVANATDSVLEGNVNIVDVQSIAYLGLSSTYFEIRKEAVKADDGTDTIYYANILASTEMPANAGMRYLTGMSFSNRISAMKQSMKVQEQQYTGSYPVKTTDPNQQLRLVMRTSNALQSAKLGTLDGEEAYGIKDMLFVSTTEDNVTTYRYFDARRVSITTLDQAAVSTGADKAIRFNNAIKTDVFNALVATYGAENVNVGMLIAKADDIKAGTVMTKQGLDDAGVFYEDVKGELLYYTDNYAVLGSAISLGSGNDQTEYTAVGYLTLTLADGTTTTYWSATSATRSAAAVATTALADTAFEPDDTYVNEVNGKYSPYTADERDALSAYVK